MYSYLNRKHNFRSGTSLDKYTRIKKAFVTRNDITNSKIEISFKKKGFQGFLFNNKDPNSKTIKLDQFKISNTETTEV